MASPESPSTATKLYDECERDALGEKFLGSVTLEWKPGSRYRPRSEKTDSGFISRQECADRLLSRLRARENRRNLRRTVRSPQKKNPEKKALSPVVRSGGSDTGLLPGVV